LTPVDPNEHDLYLLRQRWAPERTLDRRLVLATAVGMDALQAR
jgi:hypothetical protein